MMDTMLIVTKYQQLVNLYILTANQLKIHMHSKCTVNQAEHSLQLP